MGHKDKDNEKQKLSFSEKWIFDPLQRFKDWTFGDPQNLTFDTRKTFMEIIFASFGVIALTATIRKIFGKDFI